MAGRVRTDDVATVRERVPIDQVIGEVVTLRSAGAGSLKGICPFHDERSPSFHVTPARGLYYCFGCGEGGDVVDFLMKHDHLSFTEAIEKLAQRAGVTLRYEDGGAPERRGPNRTRLVAANRAAADFFTAALASPEASVGRTFLDDRGFDAEARPGSASGTRPGRGTHCWGSCAPGVLRRRDRGRGPRVAGAAGDVRPVPGSPRLADPRRRR